MRASYGTLVRRPSCEVAIVAGPFWAIFRARLLDALIDIALYFAIALTGAASITFFAFALYVVSRQ